MNIIEKLGITLGEFKIRKCTDNSGDYERNTYDILDCYSWGSNYITGEIAHPIHARVFATSPKVIEALITSLVDLEHYYTIATMKNEKIAGFSVAYKQCLEPLEEATGKTWKEIKELQ